LPTRRHDYSVVRHLLIPGFGLLANIVCMAFYLISPVFGLGTFKEPLLALGISGVWGIYGAIYFIRSSKAKGKAVLLTVK
jgi:APA family basic amino acid/polyamine antiporter